MKIGIPPHLSPETLLPSGGPWRPMAPEADLLALMEAVGTGGCPWFEGPSEPAGGGWPLLLVVDEAADSQYDRVVETLRRGGRLPDRAACLALSGRGFHGQRNRPWAVRRGNLHLVAHFTPLRPVREIGHGFSLLSAVAAVRAIGRLAGGAVTVGIKWVNDIVAGERKVGGFLASTQVQGGIVREAVVGLGINVAEAPAVAPTPFVPAVGALGQWAPQVRLGSLLEVLLAELQEGYDSLLREGPMPLMVAYRAHSVILGRAVRIWPETEAVTAAELRRQPPLARGVVQAIAEDLSLVIAGHPGPVDRGRLADEEVCRRLGM